MYLTQNGYELIPSRITVEAVYDPLVDAEGEKTGKVVSVRSPIEPIFLVQSLGMLKSGTVKTLFSEQTILAPGKSLSFTFDNKAEYYLTAFGEGSIDSTGFTSLQNYTVELSRGQLSQVILSYSSTNDAVPSLLWAGDLDRDGKLDLLVNATPHYVVYSASTLFLSSMAEDGKLLQKVAMFVASGC